MIRAIPHFILGVPLLALILSLGLGGCRRAPEPQDNSGRNPAVIQATDTAGENAAGIPDPAPAPVVEELVQDDPELAYQIEVMQFVRNNAPNLAQYALKFAKPININGEIRKIIDKSPASDPSGIYADRQFAPIFVRNGQFAASALPVSDELRRVSSHGLARDIDTSDWQAAIAALEDAVATKPASSFSFDDLEQQRIAEYIVENNIDVSDINNVRKLVSDIVQSTTFIPRLHDTVSSISEYNTRIATLGARADVLTTSLISKLARLLAFENRTHLTDAETASLGKKPTEQGYAAIAAARTKSWMLRLAESLDANTAPKPVSATATDDYALENADSAAGDNAAIAGVPELIDELYPPYPGYRLLMNARDRYESLADWKTDLTQTFVKTGRQAKVVPQLRKRLAAEGFYDHADAETNASELYDAKLHEAVMAYMAAHQLALTDDGNIPRSFWQSLNIPRTKRLAQIDENLRRWHQTQLVRSPYYIYINVPDFHGEVWRDGELKHRFPVVVGNATRECDPLTRTMVYINATPLMHARMQYIEYNPYWIVPPRIEQEDYIRKINEDPNWLVEHGFEYFEEAGRTVLRQLPSEKNALGRVKFIFPNPHSTFLHDSPQKGLFRFPVRAFSHGCMRVWEPLKLAKLLMQYDGQWYDALEREIEDMQNRRYILRNRFDVFIDYFTVRADDAGVVYFLADPYRYVRDALEPPDSRTLQCVPQPKEWIKRAVPGDAGADIPGNIRVD